MLNLTLRLRPRLSTTPLNLSHRLLRPFTSLPPNQHPSPLPPRPTIPESSITESFLKGTGPGGQKINKTSSAVQLKHLPTGIVIKCQETRSRTQNRKIARRILAERIEMLEKGEESRVAVKEERVRRKKASSSKKSRRKYRKLEEGKEGIDGEEGEEGEEEALADEVEEVHEVGSGRVVDETKATTMTARDSHVKKDTRDNS